MTRSNILLHLLAFFGDTCICYVVWPFCFCSIVFVALVDWFLSSGMSLVRKHLPLHVPMLGGCCIQSFGSRVFWLSFAEFIFSALPWFRVYPWDFILLPQSLTSVWQVPWWGYGGGVAGFWVGTAAKWVFFCLGVRLYLHPTSLGPPLPLLAPGGRGWCYCKCGWTGYDFLQDPWNDVTLFY